MSRTVNAPVRTLVQGAAAWLLPTLAGLLLAACSKIDVPRADADAEALPLTEYHDTTVLDMHDGSRLSWRLTTTHLVRWPGSELVHASPVDLRVFDSTGALAVTVTSDSGAVDEVVNFLLARGSVHGRSAKGMELFTDSLRWSKALNQVTTEASVKVISENGDVLTGRGFVSDANLDHWQILADVRGVFPNAAERGDELGGIGADAAASAGDADAAPGAAPDTGTSMPPGGGL